MFGHRFWPWIVRWGLDHRRPAAPVRGRAGPEIGLRRQARRALLATLRLWRSALQLRLGELQLPDLTGTQQPAATWPRAESKQTLNFMKRKGEEGR